MVNQEVPASELFGNVSYTEEMKDEAVGAVHAAWDAFEAWQKDIMQILPVIPRIVADASSVSVLPDAQSMESF